MVVIKYCGVIILIESYFQLIYPLDKDALSLNDIVVDEQCQGSRKLNKEGSDIADGCCPTVGMYFESPNDVNTFYHQYAVKRGFDIRTRSSKKGIDNELRYFVPICSR